MNSTPKKKSQLLKYLVIGVVGILLISVVGKRMNWWGGKEATKVCVEEVGLKDIYETVSASGKVQPEKEVKISPDVSGEVVELYIKEGDRVQAGQLLAKINPNIYASGLERMEASLNTSKANLASSKARMAQSESQLAKARASYDRNKKLFADGAISASEWEAAKSAYEVALADLDATKEGISASEYNVKSAGASVKESKESLNKTSIIAPVSGIISKLNVEKGERVVGTSQMAGTEMMRIANLSEMEVIVDVSENDILRVHYNDTADVEVDSYMGRKFKGVVTEISSSANVSGVSADQVTNFTVKIRIIRSSYEDLLANKPVDYSPFKPGMTANVDIKTRRAMNSLSVPVQSVTTREIDSTNKAKVHKDKVNEDGKITNMDNLKELVFVVKDGKVKQVEVKTGIQNSQYIQVLSGLKKGEKVVSGPYSAISRVLKEGNSVKVVKKEDLFEEEPGSNEDSNEE